MKMLLVESIVSLATAFGNMIHVKPLAAPMCWVFLESSFELRNSALDDHDARPIDNICMDPRLMVNL